MDSSRFSEMEYKSLNRNKKGKQTLPPRRGAITAKIFKSIAKSAAEIFTLGNNNNHESSKGRNGGLFVSTSTTPRETPSGFTSDADL